MSSELLGASCANYSNVSHELIGGGMLVLASDGRGLPLDYDELEHCAITFHVDTSDEALEDLRRRITATDWPEKA